MGSMSTLAMLWSYDVHAADQLRISNFRRVHRTASGRPKEPLRLIVAVERT